MSERAPSVLVSGVVLSQPMGGVRRHNQELLPRAARLLCAGGGRLAVLVGRDGLALDLPDDVERIPSAVPAGPPLARARTEAHALRATLTLAERAARPFDLVHTAHLPAPRALGVPYTITLHDLRALELEHTPFSRRLVARSVIGSAVTRAAAVITVSETVRAALAQRFAPRATFVVPNAGDHLPLLPRAPGPEAALLALGHVEPRKNLELVLRALALDRALPPLAIAGLAKADEAERLGALAEELAVSNRVRFLGAVPEAELPRLYAGCAAVVLPSRLEGFGIGVLEAQRARAPLAVADAGALPEVAGPGVPRFAPDDAAACARAIHAALEADAATLAEHARRAERFTWQASAEALVAAWNAAVSGRP